VLPAGGRQGDPPPWPIDGPYEGEMTLWRELWATPQAHEWIRLGWTRTVARYCRALLSAESDMRPQMLAQVAGLEDRLGLTPKAMRMLMWQIAPDELAEKREQASGTSARDRMRAI
jgi:hypothetical protein